MRHTITFEDVKLYEFTHQIAGAFGKSENKELLARVRGNIINFEVLNDADRTGKRVKVFGSSSLALAVNAYNKI